MRSSALRRALVVLTALFAVALVVLLAWGDSRLDDAVVRVRAPPPVVPEGDNLFYPLAGFPVAADRDPVTEARAAVARVNRVLRAATGIEDDATGAAVRAAWIVSALGIEDPQGLLCRASEAGCLARLAGESAGIRRLAEANSTLLGRYRGLRAYPSYRTDLVPHVSMPFPAFGALLGTHRLALAEWLAAHLSGAPSAVPAVRADLEFLRGLLAAADTLLVKMVAASMVAETLHAYAAMLDRGEADPGTVDPIAALSAPERSLRPALVGEFLFQSQAFGAIEASGTIHEDFRLPRWLGPVALRPIYKPNRTLNAAHRCWRQVVEVTELSAPELAQRMRSGAVARCRHAVADWALNPVGTILVSIAGPTFERYAARMHDLGGLIGLVNLKLALRRLGIAGHAEVVEYLAAEGASYSDPYRGAPVRFDEADGTFRIDSPAPHPGFDRLPLDPLSARSGDRTAD